MSRSRKFGNDAKVERAVERFVRSVDNYHRFRRRMEARYDELEVMIFTPRVPSIPNVRSLAIALMPNAGY